jgi:beta-glucanase (GH16 family)
MAMRRALCSPLFTGGPPKAKGNIARSALIARLPTSADFHTYGLLWTEQVLIFYFDRQEVWRQPTPLEARTPMYLLVNLALGSGWPITNTPNPSTMLVDYVRAYATKTANASREPR